MAIEGETDLEWIWFNARGPGSTEASPHECDSSRLFRPSLIFLELWSPVQMPRISITKCSVCWCSYKWHFKNSVFDRLLLAYGNIVCTLLNSLVNSKDLLVDSFSFFLFTIMFSTKMFAFPYFQFLCSFSFTCTVEDLQDNVYYYYYVILDLFYWGIVDLQCCANLYYKAMTCSNLWLSYT